MQHKPELATAGTDCRRGAGGCSMEQIPVLIGGQDPYVQGLKRLLQAKHQAKVTCQPPSTATQCMKRPAAPPRRSLRHQTQPQAAAPVAAPAAAAAAGKRSRASPPRFVRVTRQALNAGFVEPTQPEPAKPEPAKPKSAQPLPAEPDQAKPEPSKPLPAEPQQTKPVRVTRQALKAGFVEPTQPEPAKPKSAQPLPAEPDQAKPEPSKPLPAEPQQTKPVRVTRQALKAGFVEPTQPEPAKAEPAKPKSAQPLPAEPDQAKPVRVTRQALKAGFVEPTQPEPAKAKPAKPKSAEPEAAKPKSAEPEAAKPKSAQPLPAEPEQNKPEPATPKSAEPKSAKTVPAEPEQNKPEPATPKPAEAEPTKPEPAAPQQDKPEPATPKSTEPESAQPLPAEAEQTKPEPAEPQQDKPEPATPKSTEPESAKHMPAEPEDTKPEPATHLPAAPEPGSARKAASPSKPPAPEQVDIEAQSLTKARTRQQAAALKDELAKQQQQDADQRAAELQGLQDLAQELETFGIPWVPADWQVTAHKGKSLSGSNGWRFTYTIQKGATYSNKFDAVGAAMVTYNCWPTQRYAHARGNSRGITTRQAAAAAAGRTAARAAAKVTDAAADEMDATEGSAIQDDITAVSDDSMHDENADVAPSSDSNHAHTEHATLASDSNSKPGKSDSEMTEAVDVGGGSSSDGVEGEDAADKGDGSDTQQEEGPDGSGGEADDEDEDSELIVNTATVAALQAAAADTLKVYIQCKDGKQLTALLCNASQLLQGKLYQRGSKFLMCSAGTYRPVAAAQPCTMHKLMSAAGYKDSSKDEGGWPALVRVAQPLYVNHRQLKDRTLAQVLAAVKCGPGKKALRAQAAQALLGKRPAEELTTEAEEGIQGDAEAVILPLTSPSKHARLV